MGKNICFNGHNTLITGRLLSGICRVCNVGYQKKYRKNHLKTMKKVAKRYYIKNFEKIQKRNVEYRNRTKEQHAVYGKHYKQLHKKAIKETYEKWKKKRPNYFIYYRQNNKEKRSTYAREKRSLSVCCKLAGNLRNRLNIAIKNNRKSGSAVKDLGCTIEKFKKYLALKFTPGMTWDNWGRGFGKWNIDHIIPLGKVNLADKKQFLKAVHYTNLQPLWFSDNLRKGCRVV